MSASPRIAVVGTGSLGGAVVADLVVQGFEPIHTFNSNRRFPDSVQFDVFRDDLAGALPLPTLDAVIVAINFEARAEPDRVLRAIRSLASSLADKRLIYISSDAVFDGRVGMYSEFEVPVPRTQYGKGKAMCEQVVRGLVPNHCILRTSYIYGYSNGTLDTRLKLAKDAIRRGEKYSRFMDMYKSPTEVNQLASAIGGLCRSEFRGTLHLAGERMSVYDFFHTALASLGEDVGNLIPARMPVPPEMDMAVDTSLDSSLAARVLGFTCMPVVQAMRGEPQSQGIRSVRNEGAAVA